METTLLELFNYRTPMGCHVFGHKAQTEEGIREHVTLATEAPPPVLQLQRARQGVDKGGKVWP
jgi:hypothetical protein